MIEFHISFERISHLEAELQKAMRPQLADQDALDFEDGIIIGALARQESYHSLFTDFKDRALKSRKWRKRHRERDERKLEAAVAHVQQKVFCEEDKGELFNYGIHARVEWLDKAQAPTVTSVLCKKASPKYTVDLPDDLDIPIGPAGPEDERQHCSECDASFGPAYQHRCGMPLLLAAAGI